VIIKIEQWMRYCCSLDEMNLKTKFFMKNILLSFFNVFLFLNFASAQSQMIDKVSFEDAEMAAYQIEISIAPDRVIDLWDEFWDDHYNVDVDRDDRSRDREIYLAKEVKVEAISEKQIDVYSRLSTTEKDKTTVSLGFGVGYDVYANKDQFSDIFAAAERILNEFEAYSYRKFYSQRMEEWQKELEEAREEKAEVEEDIAKRESKIASWKKDIEDLESDIAKARKENKAAQNNLPEKIKRVNTLERELRAAEQLLTRWQ
jgi:predicted  nucleic acid-binding Zn-ribbon protein